MPTLYTHLAVVAYHALPPNKSLEATATAVAVAAFGFNRAHSLNRAVPQLVR